MKPAAKFFAPVSLGHAAALAAALSLTFSLAGCSSVREGTVISKRERPADPDFQRLGPTYAVEIEGRAHNGKTQRETVLVSRQEWTQLQIGDRFVVGGHREETKALAQNQAQPKPQPSPEKAEKKTQKKQKTASEKIAATTKHAPSHPEPSAAQSPAQAESSETPAAKKHAEKTAAKSKQHPTEKPAATAPAATPSASPAPSVVIQQSTPKPSPTAQPSPTTQPSPQASLMTFEKAQVQALEDPRVREMKAKIHAASSDEERRKAANDYYRALYGKMRELAPAAKDRIDKEEASKIQNTAAASATPQSR